VLEKKQKMPPQLRFEFYLPTFYNNEKNPKDFGKPIEKSKFRIAKNKIINNFGCLSIHSGIIQGTWTDKDSKIRYFDNCRKFEVCVNNRDDIIDFMINFKEFLKKEFEQHDIYMIYTEVEML